MLFGISDKRYIRVYRLENAESKTGRNGGSEIRIIRNAAYSPLSALPETAADVAFKNAQKPGRTGLAYFFFPTAFVF